MTKMVIDSMPHYGAYLLHINQRRIKLIQGAFNNIARQILESEEGGDGE
jgi:hypothetical protein